MLTVSHPVPGHEPDENELIGLKSAPTLPSGRRWWPERCFSIIGDASRFPGPHHFAACNGTAPVEVSSGNRKVHRLSLRGNRRINHAIQMAAINQLRYKHSRGRAYYDNKTGEKTRPTT